MIYKIYHMKSVVFVWTQSCVNLENTDQDNFWGINDVVRGMLATYELCRQHEYPFYIDLQLHPISQFIENPGPSNILLIYFGLELQYLNRVKDEFSAIGNSPDVLIIASLNSKIHLMDLNLGKYASIIIIDTSKSEISYAQKLASDLKSKFDKILYVGRTQSDAWGFVNSDEPETAPSGVLNMWKRSQKVE